MQIASRIDSIFVPALNADTAAAWYQSIFGMVEIFRSLGHVGLRFPGAGPHSTALTLVTVNTMPPQGIVAFNVFSPDPEALRAALLADGREATPISHHSGLTWFDFVDVSGNRVNVCHFAES